LNPRRSVLTSNHRRLDGDRFVSPHSSDVNDRRGFSLGIAMSEPRRNIATATILIGVLLLFLGSFYGNDAALAFGGLILASGIVGKLVELIARSAGMK